jgi:cytochrome b561
MVSREKLIEKQLDDIRNLVLALIIGVVISIPAMVFVQGVKPELKIAFAAYCTGLIVLVVSMFRILKKLYEEYSRDPGMTPYLGIYAIAITVLALITLIIAMLVT